MISFDFSFPSSVLLTTAASTPGCDRGSRQWGLHRRVFPCQRKVCGIGEQKKKVFIRGYRGYYVRGIPYYNCEDAFYKKIVIQCHKLYFLNLKNMFLIGIWSAVLYDEFLMNAPLGLCREVMMFSFWLWWFCGMLVSLNVYTADSPTAIVIYLNIRNTNPDYIHWFS